MALLVAPRCNNMLDYQSSQRDMKATESSCSEFEAPISLAAN
jgi:hypothetical protein